MGAHNSIQNGQNGTENSTFKGNSDDFMQIAFVVLGLTMLWYVLRKCVRKMNGTTTVTFIFHHKTQVGEEVRVVGNTKGLGQWDPKHTIPMKFIDQKDDPVWVAHLDVKFPLDQSLEYKYVLMMSEGGQKKFKEWEPCANRVLRDKRETDADGMILHQRWGGRDTKASNPFADLVGCNAMTQPLIGG